MATEIASLYARVSADTADLKRGLQDASRRLDDAEKKINRMGDASERADRQTRKHGGSLKDFAITVGKVGTVAAAAGLAIKKAFDFAKQGAVVAQTEASFERLGVSINALRGAARGTVDDMTLMSSTLTLAAGASVELQGHLLQAAPQLMEIAKAASALNPALGDTASMYQSIATGIKRSSPLILDNLGIVVKLGEANEAYAKQLGKTVEEMSAEEKQVALLNATLEAGGRLLEQAGGTAEAAGDAYAQFSTNTKNATAELKENIHQGLEPLVRWLNDTLFAVRELRQEQETLLGQSLAGGQDYATYIAAQAEAIKEAGGMGRKQFWSEWSAAANQAIGSADQFAITMSRDVDAALALVADGTVELTGVMSRYRYEIEQTGGMAMERWRQYGEAVGATTTGLEYSIATHGRWTRSADGAMAASMELAKQQERLAEAHRADRDRLEELAAAQEQFGATKWAIDQDFGEQMDAAGQSLDELRTKAGQLEDQLANADLTPEEVGALRGQLSGIRGDIDGVIKSMQEMSAQFVLGLIEMQIAADGEITETEAQMYTAYAYHMGLIDETAVSMANSITTILGDATLSAEEKMQALIDVTQGAVDKYGEMRDVGTGSLADIITKADDAMQALLNLGLSAEAAQTAIDRMHGKTIDMEVTWVETNRPELPGGGYQIEPKIYGHFAEGGTLPIGATGIAGEAGPELLTATAHGTEITPLAGGDGAMLGGSALYGDIIIQGAVDPEATARAVIRELEARGFQMPRFR